MAITSVMGVTSFDSVIGVANADIGYVMGVQNTAPAGPWDVSTKSLNGSFSMTGTVTNAQGLRFSDDGTKFYVVDSVNAVSVTVKQFNMSSAWDVTTASYSGTSFNVMPQVGNGGDGIAFGNSGSAMYVHGSTNNAVYQYTLSTPWDLSTASYASLFSNGYLGRGIFMKPDGTKMFKQTSNTVTGRYSITSWDVSTAATDSNTITTSSQGTAALDFFIRPDDGSQYFMVNNGATGTEAIYQYTLSTPWDLSSGSYASLSLNVSGQDTTPRSVNWKPDGTRVYMSGSSNGIYQYD